MPGYVKLFGSILDSTVWVGQTAATKVMWVTVLAMKDAVGEVFASVPGLAQRAGVTIEECEKALAIFTAPDAYSRTKDHDGRRIEEIDGGWAVLNHDKYKFMETAEVRRTKNAERQKRYRDNAKAVARGVTKRNGVTQSSTPSHDPDPDPDPDPEEKESERAPPPPPVRLSVSERPPRRPYHIGAATVSFLAVYDRYPNKTGKIAAAQVFQELAQDAPGGEQGLAGAILDRFDRGMLKRPPYDGPVGFVKALEGFLAERRWEDADQPADPEPEVAEPFAVRAERRRQDAAEERFIDQLREENRPKLPQKSPREEYAEELAKRKAVTK